MTDSTPYLIAHKVRGQPAFDIAIQMQVEDEVWWIIPTSGHRAYPFWHLELFELSEFDCNKATYVHCGHENLKLDKIGAEMPADIPDHYWSPGQTSDIPSERAPAPRFSLASLGLEEAPKISIRRRPIT